MNIWDKMYAAAEKVRGNRTVSPFIEAGEVAAAILTKAGNIYVGICIDAACGLGMCAERNAAANMLTNGENEIVKILAIMDGRKVGPPCGACREYLMQLGRNNGDAEILLDYSSKRCVPLKSLVPQWWGDERNES